MTEVSVRELRNNLPRYLRRLEAGERFTVTRRGKPVGRLEPPERASDDAWLWKMVREGKASWSGKKFNPAPPKYRLKGEGPTLSEMIIEGRGDPLP
jgi:prevent-host-death family protein